MTNMDDDSDGDFSGNLSGVSYEVWGEMGRLFADPLNTGLDAKVMDNNTPWHEGEYVFTDGNTLYCHEWTQANGFWHPVTDALMFSAIQEADRAIYKMMGVI